MLMHCSRLLRRGAVCALLLVVARLISSSLVLDSIPPMQQYFRVVRGQPSALDDVVNSSAVPVIPSVSSEMSETGASGESADGRSAAASLSFARQLASLTENAVAQSGVISETAAVQASLTADVAVMNTAPGQLVGAVGNLVTKHDNLTTQVGSLATTVTVTDNTVNTVAATSRNLVDAMNVMPDMSQAVATIVELAREEEQESPRPLESTPSRYI